MTEPDYPRATGREIRALCRAGKFDQPTTGAALGFTQANLVLLRDTLARDFETFCRLNPKPCPLLEVTEPGHFEVPALARDADLRTDLPRYRVYRHGRCVERPPSIVSLWQDDLVAFLIGCSFTFESALIEAGLPVRHLEQRRNVPMYRTNVPCRSAGPFSGPLIVSMRPMRPDQAAVATRLTETFEHAHGGPVHIGDPRRIGIADPGRPDYGEVVTVHPGEVPVFWACGVTPLEAIMRAEPDLAITHEPGHMFVTDVLDRSCERSRQDRRAIQDRTAHP